MAPIIEGNEFDPFRLDLFRRDQFQLPVLPPPPPPPVEETNLLRQSDFSLYGDQQRNRLERFLVPGLSGLSVSRDIRDFRLAEATIRANNAYTATYQSELNALANPAVSPNPPGNIVEVSTRAETAYRQTLSEAGFTPLDVRGISVVKAADYLRSQSVIRGDDFTTLSPSAIQQRIATDQETRYFVRILDQSRVDNADPRLSRPQSPHTWVATPEEISGARLDTYETMRRVGFSDDYISWIQGEVAAGRKELSDFVLSVTEADGTSGRIPPSWDVLTQRAQTHPDFSLYHGQPDSFWRDVQNLDFRTALADSRSSGAAYLTGLSPYERDVFNARQQMSSILGVNEFFTNDGRTARTDGRNGTYGVREFLIDNNQIPTMQRTTFLDLNQTRMTDLRPTNSVVEIPDNVRSFRNETRSGALIGGGFSAVTSLPQVFEQAQNGDHLGATQTFIGNTALGTGVGAFSSAGEQIVGNQIADRLGNSTFAQNGINRLYANDAARGFVSRTVQTEASTLTSSTFNSTVRTMAGRVGGAGLIGGVVNGGFAAYDQIGAYNRGEVTASQAIGTVTGEAAVGVGSGLAGAAAGAAIGSIIPGAGTIVGGVIGFGVGMVAGYFADQGLRGLGVNTAIAEGVTAMIDGGAEIVGQAQQLGGQAVEAVSNTFNDAADAVGGALSDAGNAISGGLRSIFG